MVCVFIFVEFRKHELGHSICTRCSFTPSTSGKICTSYRHSVTLTLNKTLLAGASSSRQLCYIDVWC